MEFEEDGEGESQRKSETEKMLALVLLLCLLVTSTTAQSPSTDGFFSIDCGLDSKTPYKDPDTGLFYFPDEPYTSAGVNKQVTLGGGKPYEKSVRSFPEGLRNCYTLPVRRGFKYKINAEFIYGNYDELLKPPTFDLYLDVDLWATVVAGVYNSEEIIARAVTDTLDVCLVNIAQGTPFISKLDLCPLPLDLYPEANSEGPLVLTGIRQNFGTERQISFPDDPYDRIWYGQTSGTVINSSYTVLQPRMNNFSHFVPPDVLKTAIAAPPPSYNLSFSVSMTPVRLVVVYIYIAELQKLSGNDTREFSISFNDFQMFKNYRPAYLQSEILSQTYISFDKELSITLFPTKNSTLPPLINALEAFIVHEPIVEPMDQTEVGAILEVKKYYGVKKNWQGNPCRPEAFIWEGVKCSLDPTNRSRIYSLDLSRSALSGGISPSIANLSQLTYLDLSDNNLTGEIPSYLGELPLLKFLDLERNNLTGNLPGSLSKRLQGGSFELRIRDNPNLCFNETTCLNSSRKKIIAPTAIGLSIASVFIIAMIISIWILKRRKYKKSQHHTNGESQIMEPGRRDANSFVPNGVVPGFASDSHQFSSSDIASITDNFKEPIGRGGFGVVYHGYLEDSTEVAVKVLSVFSAEGEKQFINEAQLLTRVHYKYLVSLLGYCNENLALVYEFVPLGSLSDHLSGHTETGSQLSWNIRLQIALEAAQGLDYLHTGCQPPIIHRDVKTSNILLTETLGVKLADFGLSRSFNKEDVSYISTVVAGTPGYLDPDYFQTNRLNEKSDVYSFGVVLLELVTGKPPISKDMKRTHITKHVKTMLEKNDITQIVDGRMNGEYDIGAVSKIIEIALSCTSLDSDLRPTISDVVVQLKECQTVEHAKKLHSDSTSDFMSTSPQFTMLGISATEL